MAVADQPEISFSIPQGKLPWQQILLVLVHGYRWTKAARDSAGQANVGLCPAGCI